MVVTLSSIALCGYIFIGYPLVVVLADRFFKGKPINKANVEPRVSMIVSCYNEREVIDDKISNCLAIAYPTNKIEFVFVSDASDDGTDEAVAGCGHEAIRLVRQPERLGKTMGLNLALKSIDSDVVVFSDANAMYAPDAVARLVQCFADPSVGYAVGAALYTDKDASDSARSEASYWSFEHKLKAAESKFASVVGGDGAIYAIRRELYAPLQAQDINDFVNPLQIIAQGFRGVFEQSAVCYEETAGDFDSECRRKRRIVNRSITGLWRVKSVLNPFKYGVFSIFLISHKLLRWLAPFPILAATLGILALAFAGIPTGQVLVLGLALFATLAWVAHFFGNRRGLPAVLLAPYYFVRVNWSSLLGLLDAWRGNIQVTWQTSRTKGSVEHAPSIGAWLGIILFLGVLTAAGLSIVSLTIT